MGCGGYFKSNGYTPVERKRLFYGVCIWVRILLAIFVWYAFTHFKKVAYILPPLIILGSVGTIYTFFKCKDTKVWWSRRIHSIFASILIVMSILTLLGKLDGKWMGVVLLGDVLFGIIWSFIFS